MTDVAMRIQQELKIVWEKIKKIKTWQRLQWEEPRQEPAEWAQRPSKPFSRGDKETINGKDSDNDKDKDNDKGKAKGQQSESSGHANFLLLLS